MNAALNAKVVQFGKRCPRCEQVKPVTEFYKNALRPGDGYASRCKACDKKYHKARLKKPGAAAARKPYNFNASLKSRYGITADDAREMLKQQFGLCGNRGCGAMLSFDVDRRASNRAQVDHCHRTGQVRGVLCRRCNTSASILEKDENVYIGLLEYLTHHSQLALSKTKS